MRLLMVLMIFLTTGLSAQEISQKVFGQINDGSTGEPLSGAHIVLENSEIRTVADETGRFVLEKVPLGRHIIRVSHAGYQTIQKQIVLSASRAVEWSIQLTPGTLVLEEVAVNEGLFLSELDQGYGKRISIEQTNRIPANFFDPVRMATSFPGIMAANDQANNLVVRGHSPNTIQWKLEGMDILNPNHQANAGTLSDIPVSSGGGVNILSAQMLGNTSIIQGAAPVQYGNGLTTFDMSFRDGSDERNWTGQASLIGLDLAAEGNVGKGNFLVNYRYSTVGLLSQLFGIDFGGEEITFQDLSFHVNQQLGEVKWKVFGFGGQSRNHFDNSEEVREQKDWYIIDYEGLTGAVGTSFTFPSGFEFGVIHSSTVQSRDSEAKPGTPVENYSSTFSLRDNLTSLKLSSRKRLSEGVFIRYGLLLNRLSSEFDLRDTTLTYRLIDQSEFTDLLLQPYAEVSARLSSKWLFQGGFRYFGDLIGGGIIEPRIKFDFLPGESDLFSVGYSHQSMRYQSTFYHSRIEHQRLNPARFHLINGLWEKKWSGTIKTNMEFYGIAGSDLPVSGTDNDSLAWVNMIDEIPAYFNFNSGSSFNYGLEFTVEKALIDHFYGLVGGALFRSKYKNSDVGEFVSSRFDNQYSLHATFGYEKHVQNKSKNKKLNLNSRLLYIGGLNSYPLDPLRSNVYKRTLYDYSAGYSVRQNDYFRLDLSVSFTRFREGLSRTVSIDIQNMLGIKNEGFDYWDAFAGEVRNKEQLGLIPVLSYRVEF